MAIVHCIIFVDIEWLIATFILYVICIVSRMSNHYWCIAGIMRLSKSFVNITASVFLQTLTETKVKFLDAKMS